MPSGEEALICFDHLSLSTSCELFDGTKSKKLPFHSSFTHSTGGLGLYQNAFASSIGCYENKHYKAETLSASGWTDLPDHPFDIRSHSLVGLDNGAMLLLGGFAFEVPQSAIWKLLSGAILYILNIKYNINILILSLVVLTSLIEFWLFIL
ncbi:unnamed protein product [Oikopleura dioica]|uniref:Uncharacterized protein n=1 Tax=Oikopleura dioica TaxID=34765 RepID=E4XUE7_OIKDI|nr:unnamed protein product [Oikopleura dioica]